jgi:large subunit ribosomal protein L31
MKQDIHPKYYPKAKVRCACGNEFTVGAAVSEIETEICSNCHPVYTGQERGAIRGGRIEKFKERAARKTPYQKKAEKKARKRNRES